MLISKMVQIEFADPQIKAVDAIYDIRKAAENAGLNLYSRYDVQLQMPMAVDGKVIVEVKVPDKMADNFAVGNRLRGIASYLLKRCDGRYDQYVVGKRLLTYTEIPAPEVKTNELATVDRLEAIVDFTKLLERSDDEAMDQIGRILAILKEGR
ncbi:MAG: hypothetical protein LUI39_13215 [Lachnospiraceae bacterium]|nr:hypothetical protein [Lachnospiraceae bacterium]